MVAQRLFWGVVWLGLISWKYYHKHDIAGYTTYYKTSALREHHITQLRTNAKACPVCANPLNQ